MAGRRRPRHGRLVARRRRGPGRRRAAGERARTEQEPRGLASPDRPRPSGRYSMFVGLAFVALIVVALLNLLATTDAGIALERGLPLAEFAVPDALAPEVDADANVAQDDCESSRNPCPEGDRRTPACEIDRAGAIRVCDLFDKPARDLVLVHPWRRLRPEPGRLRRGRATVTAAGSTSSASTSATIPGRSPGSSATTAGRSRSASTATVPSRTSTGSASARRSSSPIPGGIVHDTAIRAGNYTPRISRPRRRAARGDSKRREATRSADGRSERIRPLPPAAPSTRRCSRSIPGLYIRWLEVDHGSGRAPRELKRRLAGLSDRFARPAGDRVQDEADPLGLPGLLPPHRPRSRRAADAAGGDRPRADAEGRVPQPQPPRRRADDRDDRVRGAGAWRSTPTRSRARSGSARAARVRRSRAGPAELPAGTLVIADEERPLALLFGAIGLRARRQPGDARTALGGGRRRRRSRDRRRGGALAGRGDLRR